MVFDSDSAIPWTVACQASLSMEFQTIDWFDLFAVQGILKSLLQLHSSKVYMILIHISCFVAFFSLMTYYLLFILYLFDVFEPCYNDSKFMV